MPLLVAAIMGGLLQIAGSLIGRILIALGIGYATYTGVSAVFTSITSLFVSSLSATSAQVAGFAGMLKLDTAFQILVAAGTARLTLNGLSAAGSVKKMGVK